MLPWTRFCTADEYCWCMSVWFFWLWLYHYYFVREWRKGSIHSNFLSWATPTDCCFSWQLAILWGQCLWSHGGPGGGGVGWHAAGRSEKRVDKPAAYSMATVRRGQPAGDSTSSKFGLTSGSLSQCTLLGLRPSGSVSGPGPQKRELGNLHKARMAPSGCFYTDVVLLSWERTRATGQGLVRMGENAMLWF